MRKDGNGTTRKRKNEEGILKCKNEWGGKYRIYKAEN
jgi:hypothetical protein